MLAAIRKEVLFVVIRHTAVRLHEVETIVIFSLLLNGHTARYGRITDEDIVYIDGIANNGWYVGLNETTKCIYGAIWNKFIKRSFLGNARCPETNWEEDKALNNSLQAKPHTDKFTHILAYRYNHPREGSLCWIENHKK